MQVPGLLRFGQANANGDTMIEIHKKDMRLTSSNLDVQKNWKHLHMNKLPEYINLARSIAVFQNKGDDCMLQVMTFF